jgi:PilZ domain
MQALTNRRQYNRSKLEILVGVQRFREFEFGLSAQLGAGGMLIMLQSQVSKGEEIEVSFFVPAKFVPAKKEMIIAKARILYMIKKSTRFCYVGICFTEISAPNRELVRDYVDQRNAMLS